MGFSVPIGTWLRGELKDWAEALLDESRLKREGYFHPAPIRQKREEHQAGHRNWQYYLWDVPCSKPGWSSSGSSDLGQLVLKRLRQLG